MRASCEDDPDQARCRCIAAGSLVRTPSGERPIEALRAGDAIFSIDEATGREVAAVVAQTMDKGEAATLRFLLEDGRVLLATGAHPLYDLAAKTYRLASTWKPGERLASADGPLRPVAIRSIEPGPKTRVLDLSVDSPFRNFVAGGVLVHNKAPLTRTE